MAFNLSDYVTGAENIQPSDFSGPPDGTYAFELTDIYLKEGSQKDPDARWIFVEYQLETGQKYNELFTLPKDPDRPTTDEQTAIGRYLARLISLGVDRSEVNTVDTDTLVGRTGALTLRTTTNRRSGREYQNVAKLVLDEITSGPDRRPADAGFLAAGATPTTSKANPFSRQ